MDQYLGDLKIAIANLLDAFDAVEPLRILTKIKLHLLAHIPDDVRRFGPLIRSSTEIYESYNVVFRLCSVLSNHQAPSRDISRKFAAMSRVKHLLSGGFWEESPSKWTQSGSAVQETLQSDIVLQRHLGWVSPRQLIPGTVTPLSLKRRPPFQWDKSAAARHSTSAPSDDGVWRAGRSLVTQDGDQVALQSWVVAKHEGRTVFGRVHELLVGVQHLATLEQFTVASELHPIFGWPILRRPTAEEIVSGVTSFVVLEGKSVQFVISVQHDCRMGHCKPTVVGKQMQERQETSQDWSLIKHTDDDHFILNMSGLHNFAKVRRILSRALIAPKPLYTGPSRIDFHKEVAGRARATREGSRKKTAQKRRETAALKRKNAQLAEEEARKAEISAREAEDASATGQELRDGDDLESEDRTDDEQTPMEEEGSVAGNDEPASRGMRSRRRRR
ncbi:hypothetical protein R3P38DRAFT_2525048 [Favolaschia claudopus]|uniref:Uncharacterized protein n=1 Tax=Favolaschia claudopus TaxID=2862362 RepID=A0AAW0BQS2_9AGAR